MKKQYYTFIIVMLIFLLGIFYWYELRPRSIKKQCYEEANTAKVELNRTYISLLESGVNVEEQDLDQFLKNEYSKCLMKNGID